MSDDDEQQYKIVYANEPNKEYRSVVRDGLAVATYPNDDVYEGHFVDGMKHGKGIYRFAQGGVYEGDYQANKKHGPGSLTMPDGGKFVGSWVEDKREGEGVYVYANGDRYDGQWSNGAKHGWGSYYYASVQSKVTGEWSNGQLVHGTWYRHDGSRYVGHFADQAPAGSGLVVWADGRAVSGHTNEDKQWQTEPFTPAKHDAALPPVVEPSVMRKAERNIEKCVFKVDHVEGAAVLPPDGDVQGVCVCVDIYVCIFFLKSRLGVFLLFSLVCVATTIQSLEHSDWMIV